MPVLKREDDDGKVVQNFDQGDENRSGQRFTHFARRITCQVPCGPGYLGTHDFLAARTPSALTPSDGSDAKFQREEEGSEMQIPARVGEDKVSGGLGRESL